MLRKHTYDHGLFRCQRHSISGAGDAVIPSRHLPVGLAIFGMIGLWIGVCMLGCGAVSSGGVDDHLEHHLPEHKPVSFAAAVEQVRLRHERLVTEFQTMDAASVDREVSELLDIVGWLTELAADSPMKKPEWDEVNLSSKELLAIDQRIAAAAKVNPRGEWPLEANRVAGLLALLTKMVPFADVKP